MLNSTVIIGKIDEISPSYFNKKGNKESRIMIKVERSKFITDNEIVFDYIPVVINEGITSMLSDYCTIGTLIAIKGRLDNDPITDFKLICEKVSFIENHIETVN